MCSISLNEMFSRKVGLHSGLLLKLVEMWREAEQAGSLKKCQLLYNQTLNFIFFPNYKLCLGFLQGSA